MMYHPVPDPHLTAIGDITVSYALLEDQVKTLIAALMQDTQRVSQIITGGLSYKNIKALAVSMYIHRLGEKSAGFIELKGLLKRSQDLEDERNGITHSVWVSGPDSETVTRRKIVVREPGGFKFQRKDYTAKDLTDVAIAIRRLADDIRLFLERHWEDGSMKPISIG
ncbi:hypothetical protein [Pseudomonas sp. NPDC087626]|uniref:hypothetical protein n=1 Tax=Pseudomonas sp. NPDC087626 TaxID=3364444 RepID=UPI0038073E40